MMYRHQQPALSIQRDIKKALLTPIFWKRAIKHPPLVNYQEAWKLQIAYSEKVAEDARQAGMLPSQRCPRNQHTIVINHDYISLLLRITKKKK